MNATTTESEECSAHNLSAEDISLLKTIVQTVVDTGGKAASSSFSHFSQITTRYQEQPQLLDPLLEDIVKPLASLLLSLSTRINTHNSSLPTDAYGESGNDDAVHCFWTVSRFLWQLSSVRNYKMVLRFFPNEVSAFEPAVDLLVYFAQQDTKGNTAETLQYWEAHYVLLMWLSLLALIPFDLVLVDSSLTTLENQEVGLPKKYDGDEISSCPPLACKIIALCKNFLSSPGATREMAAVLLGRLLTRPDMQSALLSFFDWSCQQITTTEGESPSRHCDGNASSADTKYNTGFQLEGPQNAFLVPGVTLSLATLFKLGKRESLMTLAVHAVPRGYSLFQSPTAKNNALVRKLAVKLVQRSGLALLRQKSALWRYEKGRKAIEGIQSSINDASVEPNEQIQIIPIEEEEEEEEWMTDNLMSEAVETSIECMLSALSDRDTIVRWSAAKGLGRITNRLPQDFADHVVSSLLELFDAPAASDAAWHGGCLALAELTRRGLLLPERLVEAIPFVLKALEYDVRRGHCSVGSNVRDAAAYVCWAIARAYTPSILSDIVKKIAPALMTIACFDREVNCRRSAAAAFQESVGRLGNFPNGIDIVTHADYFSVSMRISAYLHVAPYVASFPGYFEPMAWHLLTIKMCHWDKSLRELTSKALATLVSTMPLFFIHHGLPHALSLCTSPVVESRHGAVAAVAELIFAFKTLSVPDAAAVSSREKKQGRSTGKSTVPMNTDWFPESLQAQVAEIIPSIEKKKLHKGKGGEIMRSALCRLIETTAHAGIRLSFPQLECIYTMAYENIHHPLPEIQLAAAQALSAVVLQYFSSSVNGTSGNIDNSTASTITTTDLIKERLLEDAVRYSNIYARRGSLLALGILPSWATAPFFDEILVCLGTCIKLESIVEHRDAESRVNAINSLPCVVDSMWGSQGIDPGAYMHDPTAQQHMVSRVLLPLLIAMDDYSTDNRGDIGSRVREAAMHALLQIFTLLGPATLQQHDDMREAAGVALSLILRQAIERISRVRESAGKVLQCLVPLLKATERIPSAVHISGVISSLSIEQYATGHALPALAKLIHVESLDMALLEGLAYSIGGLDAQLSDIAGEALVDALESFIEQGDSGSTSLHAIELLNSTTHAHEYTSISSASSLSSSCHVDTRSTACSNRKAQILQRIRSAFIMAWTRHSKSVRMAVPFLSTAEIIISRTRLHECCIGESNDGIHECMNCNHQTDAAAHKNRFLSDVYSLTCAEITGSSDIPRLHAASAVLCQIAAYATDADASLQKSALASVLSLLGNRYPNVRRYTAEQLYTTLLAWDEDDTYHSDDDDDALGGSQGGVGIDIESSMQLLGDIPWDGSPEVVRPARMKLFDMLRVPSPVTAAARGNGTQPAAAPSVQKQDENENYRALIEHMQRGL